MRHAKAAWPLGVEDFERPLAQRGHDEAKLAGKWLVENNVVPDFILCSAALRTRQTCTWVCQQLGDKAPTPKLEYSLYSASAKQILADINQTLETVTTLMVITHMPGVQELALRLASRDSDQDAYMGLAQDYPTSALTILEHEGDWATLDGQDARVTNFVVPR